MKLQNTQQEKKYLKDKKTRGLLDNPHKIKSKNIINHFKNNLNKKFIRTFYVAGSKLEENVLLRNGDDIDFFVVFNENKRAEFFDNLIKVNDELKQKYNNYDISFYKGPFKKENKILSHFTIYTDAKQDPLDVDGKNNASIHSECPFVLQNIFNHGKLLIGKPIENILGYGIDKLDLSQKQTWPQEYYEQLIDTDILSFRDWIKNKDGIWKLVPSPQYAPKGSPLRNTLEKYFKKFINS